MRTPASDWPAVYFLSCYYKRRLGVAAYCNSYKHIIEQAAIVGTRTYR